MFPKPEWDSAAGLLQNCVDQMQASRQWFTASVLPLSPDQLRWHPQIGCWSMGECLDHLNLTLAHYLPRIEHSVVASSQAAQDSNGLLAFHEVEREYVCGLEPPVSVKAIAPTVLQPSRGVDPDRIMDEFDELRERFARIAQRASSVDLAATRIGGSLHGPVQSVGGVLALLAAHDRRHIWQAERVRRSSRFPG